MHGGKVRGHRGRDFRRLPQTGPHIVRRTDRASRLLQGRIRRAAKMAQRKQLCRYRRALPVLAGPASSQVGFTLGILRGNGLLGGLAAWFAFTMPSALILFAFALGATAFTGPVRRRRAPRPEAGRGRRGRAGDLGHGQQPDAGSRAGRDRACGRCDRGFHRRIVWADRRHRARGHRRALAMPRRWARACRPSRLFGIARARRGRARAVRGAVPDHAAGDGKDRLARRLRCSTRFIVPARWCSAAAMSCCRCCRRKW